MRNTMICWLLAIIITVGTAIYQKVTGPTYPVKGCISIHMGGDMLTLIQYKLYRSHSGMSDHVVQLPVTDTSIQGQVWYKRYKTKDSWKALPLTRQGETLMAALPHQPPAGKLMYYITLKAYGHQYTLPPTPAIIRFRGEVPIAILIAHIIFMFSAMLLSTRAGLEALRPQGDCYRYALWATALLFCGGFVFGCPVQYYAFGYFWSGFPNGMDLTDNKTLIALLGWLLALWAGHRNPAARRYWILGAAILLLVVFLIPHSLMGSELDYSKLPR